MKIDTITGLPTIPWEGYFWRISKSQPMHDTYYYIELRRKTRFLFWETSGLVKKQMMLDLSHGEARKRAQQVLEDVQKDINNILLEKTILGDFPPKSLND